MRSLRNPVGTSRALLLLCMAGSVCSCGGPAGSNGQPNGLDGDPAGVKAGAEESVDATLEYFPLAVGNTWRYGCFAEGELQLEKTVEIARPATIGGRKGFRLSLSVNDEPMDEFLWVDAGGVLYRSFDETGSNAVPVLSRNPAIGDSFGDFRATKIAMQETPATGVIDVLVLETFDIDDPTLSAARRLEWRGQFYARGVGLVAEADGLGNECSLASATIGGVAVENR